MKIARGTKRWVEVTLAYGSGTPDDVEAVVTDPSGNNAASACTLASSYYGVYVEFDEPGVWEINFNAYTDDDAVDPVDHKRVEITVEDTISTTPHLRA